MRNWLPHGERHDHLPITFPRARSRSCAGRHLLKGWTVMDRLGEITVPTLIVAGRDDFLFRPGHQCELAAAIRPGGGHA